MRKKMGRAATVIVGCFTTLSLTAGPALAADSIPPTLSVQPPLFFQGGQIGPSSPPSAGDQEAEYTYQIPMYITWTGSDVSDICGYDVQTENAGGYVATVVTNTLRTRYDDDVTDYDGSLGGGQSVIDDWRVVAHDCAGNATMKEQALPVVVTQEDGTTPGGYTNAAISYTGTWTPSYCTCWSHGAVLKTTQKGAASTVSFTSRIANSAIALVMERAPGRGKFTVYLDGASKGTVDTYAAVASHRAVVWSGKAAAAGSHTLKIVNQATSGRTRIDLDAVLTMD